MTFKDYLQAYYSPRVHNTFMCAIERYKTVNSQYLKASYNEIIRYLHLQKQQGKKHRTIINELCVIKAFYSYLQESGRRKDHPCKELYWQGKQPRQIHLDTLYPTETMETFLKEHKAVYELQQQRDEAIIGLLIYQALTNTELVSLQTTDISLKEGTVFIRATGRMNERTLSLKASQILSLHGYIQNGREKLLCRSNKETTILFLSHLGRPLNPTSINWLISHGKEKPLLLQKIRQSVIYNLLKAGNDLRLVQTFAGHKYISSTEAYKQTGLEELQSAIDKLHPLG